MGNESQRVPVSEIRLAVLADTRAKIAAHGWTVIGVFPTPDDRGPSFAYSVGLSGQGLPEVAIYGLDTHLAHGLINEVARRMVESGVALQDGARIEGLLVDDVPLVAVVMTDTTDLNLVCECYGEVGAAVQVVWPDDVGVLPWEGGCRVSGAEQPLRGHPPVARPVYHANRVPADSVLELSEVIDAQPRQSLLEVDRGDPQCDNDIRAGWAARALVAYAAHLGKGSLGEEIETVATDLLSDMRHLFDALGVDWNGAVSRSDGHYRDEIFGQL